MKLIMESWRSYLNEQHEPLKKVIFMAGAPGSGKTTVINKLGIDDLENVNPDEFYEPALEKCGLGKDIRKIKEDYMSAIQSLKDLLSNVLQLQEPEEGWSHDVLMQMYHDVHEQSEDKRSFFYQLETTKEKYDAEREKVVTQGKCFAQAQKDAKGKQEDLIEKGNSFIIDGTGGFYSKIINQKNKLESQGYDAAMIFVDIPLQTALDRQNDRVSAGGRGLDDKSVRRSWEVLHGSEEGDEKRPGLLRPFVDRYGKEQQGYENEFGPYFFRVLALDQEMDNSIKEVQPDIEAFLRKVNEDYQSDVTKQHPEAKSRLIGKGGNKTKGSPYIKNPSMKRSKSSPPGLGGS